MARGMTLMELIVAIALSSIVAMVLGGVFLAQSRFYALQDAISETQLDAGRALDTAGLFLSSADSVLTSQTINGHAYATGTNTLVVRLPSIDASGDIVVGSYDYAAFGLDPDDVANFMYDIQASANSARVSGKFVKATLVDKLIFRYNTVSTTAASIIDFYIRTAKIAHGRTILTPSGRLYYLGTN